MADQKQDRELVEAAKQGPEAVLALFRSRQKEVIKAAGLFVTSEKVKCVRCNRHVPAGKNAVRRGSNVLGVECAKHYDALVAAQPGLTDEQYAAESLAAFKTMMAEATARGQERHFLKRIGG